MNIVVLTGAGISAESGIDTFRGAGGLWENHRVEDVATPEGFAENPALIHRFYNARRAALETVEPNAAHHALADLQRALGRADGSLVLVTQNVDDLHERGHKDGMGADVIHMHGALKSALCCVCGWRWDSPKSLTEDCVCPSCHTTGSSRPDIVWFGEVPYHMDAIEAALAGCDLFVSIGTSGAVYPAAGFVQMASAYGAKTLELNLERSQGSDYFDETRLGPATQIVPEWAASIMKTL